MKNFFLITAIITIIQAHSQNQYIDTETPTNMASGVYYQSGPGSNNGSYNWNYPYGTKLTVNDGSLNRNFELTTTGYPFGDLKIRQWNSTGSQWTLWRDILTSDANGNFGIGTSSPSEKLHVEGSLLFDIYNNGNESGLFFREGYSASNKYNLSILAYDHSNSGPTPDGLSINAYDGISFSTGSNTRNEKMRIDLTGNVGIGTTTPDSKLTVKGNIHTNEVKVDLLGAVAPDYVFYKDYDLKTLEEVETYISKKGHLPNIPSAKNMEEDGIKLKEMNLKLLEKIEELTLYTIEQEKEITILKEKTEKVNQLQKELQNQKDRLQKIETLLNSKK